MSPQKARSELMKFDSGPLVGTVRSEKLSAVRLGEIAQSCTTGRRGGAAALTDGTTRPITSAVIASSNSRSPTGRTLRTGVSNIPPIAGVIDPALPSQGGAVPPILFRGAGRCQGSDAE